MGDKLDDFIRMLGERLSWRTIEARRFNTAATPSRADSLSASTLELLQQKNAADYEIDSAVCSNFKRCHLFLFFKS